MPGGGSAAASLGFRAIQPGGAAGARIPDDFDRLFGGRGLVTVSRRKPSQAFSFRTQQKSREAFVESRCHCPFALIPAAGAHLGLRKIT